jgi:hypothetical protein
MFTLDISVLLLSGLMLSTGNHASVDMIRIPTGCLWCRWSFAPRGVLPAEVPASVSRRRMSLNGWNGMLRWLGLGLLLGTGFGSVAWAQGSTRFDGQYEVDPERETAAAAC